MRVVLLLPVVERGDRGRRLRFEDVKYGSAPSRWRLCHLLRLLDNSREPDFVMQPRAGSTREWIVSLSGDVVKPGIAG